MPVLPQALTDHVTRDGPHLGDQDAHGRVLSEARWNQAPPGSDSAASVQRPMVAPQASGESRAAAQSESRAGVAELADQRIQIRRAQPPCRFDSVSPALAPGSMEAPANLPGRPVADFRPRR